MPSIVLVHVSGIPSKFLGPYFKVSPIAYSKVSSESLNDMIQASNRFRVVLVTRGCPYRRNAQLKPDSRVLVLNFRSSDRFSDPV